MNRTVSFDSTELAIGIPAALLGLLTLASCTMVK
jgi:hypothetical protein